MAALEEDHRPEEYQENSQRHEIRHLTPLSDALTSSKPTDQILDNVEHSSASDLPSDGDNDDQLDRNEVSDEYSDDLIGFSISRAQTSIRSPTTPVIDRARALQGSFIDDHEPDFAISPRGTLTHKDFDIEPISPVSSRANTSANLSDGADHSLPHPEAQNLVPDERLPNSARRKSSAGLLGSIRNLMPGTDPCRETKISRATVKKNNSGTNFATEKDDLQSNNTQLQASQAGTIHRDKPSHLERNSEEGLSPTDFTRTANSQRMPSSNSIYLRKAPTAASTYDDTTAFDNVKQMANARYKAITDSLQNSKLKLPKLPSVTKPSLPYLKYAGQKDNSARQGGSQLSSSSAVQDESTFNIDPPHNINRTPDQEVAPHKVHPILTETLAEMKGDLVVMGGYRGSILRSAEPPNRQLWIPVKVGLNLRKVDLEVGLRREDEERMAETIFADGNLSHIGPIDISRRLLRHIKKSPNAKTGDLRLHDWGWDWRLSPDLISDRLVTFLESLPCNQPNTPKSQRGATVIAHSLGGVITRHAVNRRPDLFAGVVFAGTPQNAVNILGPFRKGDDVLLSSRVLTAQVNFSFRTSFLMLPESGRCFFQKDTNIRYDVDFFDPEMWDKYRLSPCINSALDPQSRQSIQQEPVQKGSARRKSLIGSISDSIATVLPNKPSFLTITRDRSPSIPSHSSPDNSPKYSPSASSHNLDGHHSLTPSSFPNTSGSSKPHKDPADHALEPSMQPQSQVLGAMTAATKPTQATNSTIPRSEAYNYLTRTLKEITEFKKSCVHIPHHESQNLYPPHSILFSKSVPTVFGARVANEESIKYTDAFDDLMFAAGDGVVLASAAQLPGGYRYVKDGRVESDRGHVGLLGDLEGVGMCLRAVLKARSKGVGLGVDASPEGNAIDSHDSADQPADNNTH